MLEGMNSENRFMDNDKLIELLAEANDQVIRQSLLDHFFDQTLEKTDSNGNNLLHALANQSIEKSRKVWGSLNSHINPNDIIQLLNKSNNEKNFPLKIAISNKNEAMVEKFLIAKASCGLQDLQLAMRLSTPSIVNQLLSQILKDQFRTLELWETNELYNTLTVAIQKNTETVFNHLFSNEALLSCLKIPDLILLAAETNHLNFISPFFNKTNKCTTSYQHEDLQSLLQDALKILAQTHAGKKYSGRLISWLAHLQEWNLVNDFLTNWGNPLENSTDYIPINEVNEQGYNALYYVIRSPDLINTQIAQTVFTHFLHRDDIDWVYLNTIIKGHLHKLSGENNSHINQKVIQLFLQKLRQFECLKESLVHTLQNYYIKKRSIFSYFFRWLYWIFRPYEKKQILNLLKNLKECVSVIELKRVVYNYPKECKSNIVNKRDVNNLDKILTSLSTIIVEHTGSNSRISQKYMNYDYHLGNRLPENFILPGSNNPGSNNQRCFQDSIMPFAHNPASAHNLSGPIVIEPDYLESPIVQLASSPGSITAGMTPSHHQELNQALNNRSITSKIGLTDFNKTDIKSQSNTLSSQDDTPSSSTEQPTITASTSSSSLTISPPPSITKLFAEIKAGIKLKPVPPPVPIDQKTQSSSNTSVLGALKEKMATRRSGIDSSPESSDTESRFSRNSKEWEW